MHEIVIIGAGLSGRGYLNRLFYLSNESVTFIDSNKELIQQLQQTPSYTISFGEEREALKIDNYRAYHTEDKEVNEVLSKADIIMICVGADHVKETLIPLERSLTSRRGKDVDIILAENGVHPSAPLQSLIKDSRVHLCESIIFCTTSGLKDSLDIISENLDHLPYDVPALGHTLSYRGFIKEYNFSDLLERKIYTYNCISACVAYLGYVKGYEDYAKAANDPFISQKINLISETLNQGIIKEYDISLQDQFEFSQMAIRKFQNKNIIDSIERNVRAVDRKLGESERIIAPLMILNKYHLYSEELLEVAACAIHYGLKTNTLLQREHPVQTYFFMLPEAWRLRIDDFIRELSQEEW